MALHWLQPLKTQRFLFSNKKYLTDDSVLFSNMEISRESQYSSKNFNILTLPKRDLETARVLFSFNAEQKERKIHRVYEKISYLLARMRGILNVFITFGFICIKIEQELGIKVSLLDSSYSIREIKENLHLSHSKKQKKK